MNIEPKVVLDKPGTVVTNSIWRTVINALAAVLVIAVVAIAVSMFIPPVGGVTGSQTMLTVFTTVVGFLAGLFSPSPVEK